MGGLIIWTGALLIYAAFSYWYNNRRGPLRAGEIDDYLAKLAVAKGGGLVDLEEFRRFLAEDDGKEFIMLNLVRLNSEQSAHPVSGELTDSRTLLSGYLKGFLPALLKRAGHPVYQGFKAGPYIDSWNTEADPAWTLVSSMRYRSQRDLLELATDPRFQDAHIYKSLAIDSTYSFPTRPIRGGFYVGPRVWAGLILALIAALVHLLHLQFKL